MNYKFPQIDLLNTNEILHEDNTVKENAEKIKKIFSEFGIIVDIENISTSCSMIKYEFKIKDKTRIRKIINLTDDIAFRIGVKNVRIIPIPENQTIGIEVPKLIKEKLNLGDMIKSDSFQNNNFSLPFVVGESTDGNMIIDDMAKLIHTLIAGSTGSGKSTYINSLLISLLYKLNPNELKLLLIDVKKVELTPYNNLPHLLAPVITESKKAIKVLSWLIDEMYKRYDLFSDNNVRNIKDYNAVAEDKMSRIVVIIDEFANLIMDAPEGFEDVILKLAQTSRAVGITLILCTQRPSVDIITGTIKSNIPSRIAFTTASSIDSKIILDSKGAETLLSNGDGLYKPVSASTMNRIQSPYVSDKEIENVINFIISNNDKVKYNEEIIKLLENDYVNKQKVLTPSITLRYFNGDRLATDEELRESQWCTINGKHGLYTKENIKLIGRVC